MKNLSRINNPYNDDKDFDACSIFGMMNVEGKRFSSRDPIRAIANMHDRGNGLDRGVQRSGVRAVERPDPHEQRQPGHRGGT